MLPARTTCEPRCHLRDALGVDVIPQPVNVFMRIPVGPSGELSWRPAASRGGDAIAFAAAMDCVFVVSACPQDLNAINGDRPTAMEIEIL